MKLCIEIVTYVLDTQYCAHASCQYALLSLLCLSTFHHYDVTARTSSSLYRGGDEWRDWRRGGGGGGDTSAVAHKDSDVIAHAYDNDKHPYDNDMPVPFEQLELDFSQHFDDNSQMPGFNTGSKPVEIEDFLVSGRFVHVFVKGGSGDRQFLEIVTHNQTILHVMMYNVRIRIWIHKITSVQAHHETFILGLKPSHPLWTVA